MHLIRVILLITIAGKFPDGANSHVNKSPPNSNKQPAEKKQEKAPVDPKYGIGDNSKCQKSPKIPLPLPSKN